MVRRGFHILWLCGAGLISSPIWAAAESAPTCLYQSRSFSDGALLCVQKSLMLKCNADGGNASWNTVADNDLSGRCQTSTAFVGAPAPRRIVGRHSPYRHVSLHAHDPAHQVTGKCFSFNGRSYCE
jgi:hypothetical protein